MIPIAEMIVVNMILCMTYPLFIISGEITNFLLKLFAEIRLDERQSAFGFDILSEVQPFFNIRSL